VSVLVRRHLRQTQHRVLTLKAVIVRLLAGVLALHRSARLTGRKLLETRSRDAVQLGVLSPMRDHFVRVRANEVAFQTVKVRCLVLHRSEGRRVRALSPAAGYVGTILLEITAHQGVQPLVPRGMLHEAGLVAKRVTAILAHAVEVSLMLSVAAVRVPAVFVESESVTIIGIGDGKNQRLNCVELSFADLFSPKRAAGITYTNLTYPSGTGSSFSIRIE